MDIGEAKLFPRADDLGLFVNLDGAVWFPVARGGGNDDNFRVQAAGEIDESFVDAGASGITASLDDESSFFTYI